MTRLSSLYLLVVLAILSVTAACNSNDSDNYYYTEQEYTNCGVTSFSLNANTKIAPGLDSVYFSIDLITSRVFNADSLPPGTDVTRLVPSVTASAARKIEFTFTSRFSQTDTTVNFTENPNDSINFSSPVDMTVTAYDGVTSRHYRVTVNVHRSVADTLTWNTAEQLPLPAAALAQRSVRLGDDILTLVNTAPDTWTMLTATGAPADGSLTSTSVTLPAGADINTFAATDDALYIATTSGSLYRSDDSGSTWNSLGVTMNCVYGGYGTTLLGARHDADGWKQVTYPASASEAALPAGCPVSGTSQLVNYSSKWSTSSMALMVGGTDASGYATGEAWSYDGSSWHRLSTKPLPELSGVTLFPYYTAFEAGIWTPQEQSVLIALGGSGRDDYGQTIVSKNVYISYDFGITWSLAPEYMQMPSDIPAVHSAQAFVINSTLSRVTRPITSWECPFIYLYGGVKADGSLRPWITCGVINRLTFRPIV